MTDVCCWYPVDTTWAGGMPRPRLGKVCLAPATHDVGRRCAEHAGMLTGADRLEVAEQWADAVKAGMRLPRRELGQELL